MPKPAPKKRHFSNKPQPPGEVTAAGLAHNHFGNSGAPNSPISLEVATTILTSPFPNPYKAAIQREFSVVLNAEQLCPPTFPIPVRSHFWSAVSALVPAYKKAKEVYPEFLPHDIRVNAVLPTALVSEIHDAYAIKVTLNRVKRKPRVKATDMFTETVHKVVVPPSMLADEHDNRFRTLILYTPMSSTFATVSHKVNSRFTDEDEPEPVHLPSSWLRLQKKDGIPSRGAYIREIHHVWSIDWLSNPTQIIPAYHMHDDEEGMPVMPPDFIGGVTFQDQASAAACFRQALEEYPSNRYGCRHYVKGGLHRDIPPSCLLLDQRVVGDFVLQLSPRNRLGHPET